jgi:hypothetical protein
MSGGVAVQPKDTFYGNYLQVHCLINGPKLNACDFGFYEDDGVLKPCENQQLGPDDLHM